jgi:hypothetical protein
LPLEETPLLCAFTFALRYPAGQVTNKMDCPKQISMVKQNDDIFKWVVK